MDATDKGESTVSRRKLLRNMAAASGAASIAGCSGSGESGERVPTLTYYFSSGTDNGAAVIQRNLEELGFDVELVSSEWGTASEAAFSDARDFHIYHTVMSGNPSRLDPDEYMMRWSTLNAGNGNPNLTQYANCDFNNHALAQRVTSDEDSREEHVHQAQEIMSEEVGVIPTLNQYLRGAYREDLIDANSIGEKYFGRMEMSSEFMIDSDVLDGDMLVIGLEGLTLVEDLQNMRSTSGPAIAGWSTIAKTPLWKYDENLNLTNQLADEYTFSNEGQTLTVELIDATFSDGSAITSEDVKFTFLHYSEFSGTYPLASSQNISEIETPDDNTVIFQFEEPNPRFVPYATMIGIDSKAKYEEMGADEDPDNFDMTEEDWVGSGPFVPADLSQGTHLILEPNPEHPFESPDHDLMWVNFDDFEPLTSQLIEGEIHAAGPLSLGNIERIGSELSEDQWNEASGLDFGIRYLAPQCSFGPTMFQSVRHAIAVATNRREINAIDFDGDSEEILFANTFTEQHPFRAPDDMLLELGSPEGDIEEARRILEEDGFTQDSNGNWYYPDEADLTPRWPEGEFPNEDNGFDCVSSDREWNPPEDFEV